MVVLHDVRGKAPVAASLVTTKRPAVPSPDDGSAPDAKRQAFGQMLIQKLQVFFGERWVDAMRRATVLRRLRVGDGEAILIGVGVVEKDLDALDPDRAAQAESDVRARTLLDATVAVLADQARRGVLPVSGPEHSALAAAAARRSRAAPGG